MYYKSKQIASRFLTGWFILLLMVSASAQNLPEQIPIRLESNLIFIKLSVNGSRPLNFMFDTGAGVTVLNSSVADEIPLTVTGESTINTAGRKVDAETASYNTLGIGALLLDSINLEILPLDHLSEYLEYPVDGIIGYDVFARYVVETNIDELLLKLYPSLDSSSVEGAHTEKIQKLDKNRMAIRVSLFNPKREKVTLPFLVDTGKIKELTLFNKTIKQYPFLSSKKYKEAQGFSADTTITTNLMGKIERVQFAGKEWKRVKTTFDVDPISRAASRKSKLYGLIGQELLLDFNITYDYAGGYCYFFWRE